MEEGRKGEGVRGERGGRRVRGREGSGGREEGEEREGGRRMRGREGSGGREEGGGSGRE